MESGAGNDWLEGGAGEDTYVFGKTDTGVDTIYDNDGKDHLEYEGPNTDMIYGGIGDDWLWGGSDDELWQCGVICDDLNMSFIIPMPLFYRMLERKV